MNQLPPENSELLRHRVIECLAARHPAALPLDGIVRRVRSDLEFAVDAEDVSAAVEVLEGKGLLKAFTERPGGQQWWGATAKGLEYFERPF
jgi:hypothetical protein